MTKTHATSGYVLCSNPRSGTTLLCDMLRQTGVAGAPESFFRQQSLSDWADAWGLKDATGTAGFDKNYLAAARRAGRGQTEVFGLRLMGPDLQFVAQGLERCFPDLPDDTSRLNAAFGKLRYIYLTRQDKLAEAVSYLRAEQTGLWHQNADGSVLEQMDATEPDGFDAQAIKNRMKMLCEYDAQWPDWFRSQGINPLHMTYEDLASNPQEALANVLGFVGADPALATRITPGLRKLADQTSARWIARYRALAGTP